MKNKKMTLLAVILLIVIVLALASSYALFKFNVTKNVNFKLAIGKLELIVQDAVTEDKYIIENTVPTKDDVALDSDGYTFTLRNTGTIDSYYTLYLDDILISNSGDRLDNSYVKFNLYNHKNNYSNTSRLIDYPDTDRVVDSGFLKAGSSITYTLKMWVDYNAGNDAQNKYFATQIRITATQSNTVTYKDPILNGADPVLTDNLVPVIISDSGVVTKASLSSEWYNYNSKMWANAVVLKDTNISYSNDEIIPEGNIESYFVWVPRYKYKIFDIGNYNSTTSVLNNEKTIDVIFENKDTEVSNGTTVGSYLTHPAFIAFNTNGIWVGKFETGYDGATSTTAAQINSSDTNALNKIIVKPNVYSWRGISIGNAFKIGYDYLRSDESHMMKNTEWGAVGYLQHSVYGSSISLRINNNSGFITGYSSTEEPSLGFNGGNSIVGNRNELTALGIDGIYTKNYLNSLSNISSTTGNKTGVYDISGGAWEYVMGYNKNSQTLGGLSGIGNIYSDFFTNSVWDKYYDKYQSSSTNNYNSRILGDATGEFGPFSKQVYPDGKERNKSSWYGDYAYFVDNSFPWFYRGGGWSAGSQSGAFAFNLDNGSANNAVSFRIVLAP